MSSSSSAPQDSGITGAGGGGGGGGGGAANNETQGTATRAKGTVASGTAEVAAARQDVTAAEDKVEAAKLEVKAAEAKVDAAKLEVDAAEAKVDAAKLDEDAAKLEVDAAKKEYMAAPDGVVKDMLLQGWTASLKGLEGAQKRLDGAQKRLDGAEHGLTIARKGLDGAQDLVLRLQRATDAADDVQTLAQRLTELALADESRQLARLVRDGLPPLQHTKRALPSDHTSSCKAPFPGRTVWEITTTALKISDVVVRDKDSKILSASVTNKNLEDNPTLKFDVEPTLTQQIVKPMLEDAMRAMGARNFWTGTETVAWSRHATTQIVDTWGSVDVAVFTDTGDVATAVEVKLPCPLSCKSNGFMSKNTACQILNYVSWLHIECGVKHPMALLQTGDKAALCFRQVDKDYVEKVLQMDLGARARLWPARLAPEAAAAPAEPAATTPRNRSRSKPG